MAEIRPDKVLADLAIKLAQAKTEAEAASIQDQINQRQEEIATSTSGGVGFGARGSYIPSNAPVGTTILNPTYEQGIYTRSTITGDRTFDQYGRSNLGTSVTLYDENGKPLSAEEAAKTETGLNFAAAGRDIGFGAGFIAPGVRPDIEFATFNSGRAASPNAASSAGLGSGAGNFNIADASIGTLNAGNTSTAGTSADKAARQSAYDLLYSEFERYGLQSLVEPLKGLIISGASPSEFTIKLRETDAYKKRFAANEARIKSGLRALSEAEYIRNEDAYQEVMRRRGLPPEYYTKGDLGVQKGFEALLAGDVSSTELEDRIVTAQDRVLNANPEIAAQLKQFYPGISNGDILAYVLDPANAINQIKRKVTAAEIGAAAGTYGLSTTVGRAEQLAGAGVTEATAQQGFKTISQVGPRAGVLAEFYKQDPYTQETAEKEFFGLTGAREAEMQRKKLTSLEQAAFSGSAGTGAIARDRAGVL